MQAAGNQLTGLLRAHILGAAELLAAAKAADQAKVNATSQKRYASALSAWWTATPPGEEMPSRITERRSASSGPK